MWNYHCFSGINHECGACSSAGSWFHVSRIRICWPLIRIAERVGVHCNSSHGCLVRMQRKQPPRLTNRFYVRPNRSLSYIYVKAVLLLLLSRCEFNWDDLVPRIACEESLALNSPSSLVLPLLPMPSALLPFCSKVILCVRKGAWTGWNCLCWGCARSKDLVEMDGWETVQI